MTTSGWGAGEWHDMEWGTGVDYGYAPVDSFLIRSTYRPVQSFNTVYKGTIPKTARLQPLTFRVTYVPSYSRTGTP